MAIAINSELLCGLRYFGDVPQVEDNAANPANPAGTPEFMFHPVEPRMVRVSASVKF